MVKNDHPFMLLNLTTLRTHHGPMPAQDGLQESLMSRKTFLHCFGETARWGSGSTHSTVFLVPRMTQDKQKSSTTVSNCISRMVCSIYAEMDTRYADPRSGGYHDLFRLRHAQHIWEPTIRMLDGRGISSTWPSIYCRHHELCTSRGGQPRICLRTAREGYALAQAATKSPRCSG